ncbi:peptidoglycan DD-metalloendopeptidase family protein [Maribacter sp. 2-571]|uniref:peptidoglycan DD-metalloendopeptidase family protein n=1 Tax=Maribacter sp. 2-571 TaxID=3417569 RepID=UPI003D354240
MQTIANLAKGITTIPIPILDAEIPLAQYIPINLSVHNTNLKSVDITDPVACETYIMSFLKAKNGTVAYGGYLEKRDLYRDKATFSTDKIRDVHLGVDFWCKAGTKVLAPFDGRVHSFQDNSAKGDYGPTIILEHRTTQYSFHTLYGHLSRASLKGLTIGQRFKKGQLLGTLGTSDINVNYAPHLHFQVIMDLEGAEGDYPGVCNESEVEKYTENCPDPLLLLGY